MKGIVLAGGSGSRLAPLTKNENKHYLPVYNKRMIDYPVATLVALGITDIILITGGKKPGTFLEHFKNGKDYNINRIFYTYQEGDGGIGAALKLAEPFLEDGEACTVILGDNYFETPPSLDNFASGARVLLKEVAEPWHFGVAEINDFGKILSIEEKPSTPKSDLAIIGLYQFDDRVWEYLKEVSPSARGELEITDILQRYLLDGTLYHSSYEGFWKDMGTFESWTTVSQRIAEKAKDSI